MTEDQQLRKGRHGGCKEDKDEQSSLPGCGMESRDFGQAQPDRTIKRSLMALIVRRSLTPPLRALDVKTKQQKRL